ncbi:hypothetical protein J4E82_006700 [Alternaria postmessia]|uniref:uncharacterized protein n=1 Tax=Alternaria postmessia TaxID=1187938 RepID=UPI00222509CE|nr:uncharacterized protein J4E82_006700 [Alternaria postmessia]KAI5374645.1 hypothetical protein J4E82_006700 [Alternaria postmessia]
MCSLASRKRRHLQADPALTEASSTTTHCDDQLETTHVSISKAFHVGLCVVRGIRILSSCCVGSLVAWLWALDCVAHIFVHPIARCEKPSICINSCASLSQSEVGNATASHVSTETQHLHRLCESLSFDFSISHFNALQRAIGYKDTIEDAICLFVDLCVDQCTPRRVSYGS